METNSQQVHRATTGPNVKQVQQVTKVEPDEKLDPHPPLQSPIVTIKATDAGENESTKTTVFYVHKLLLTKASDVFDRMLSNGVMTESTSQTIELHDFDVETIGRVMQYLYTGQYFTADMEAEIKKIEEGPAAQIFMFGLGYALSPPGTVPTTVSSAEPLKPEQYNIPVPANSGLLWGERARLVSGIPSPKPLPSGIASPKPLALFEHTKVYVFATQYQISAMRSFAFQKVKNILVEAGGPSPVVGFYTHTPSLLVQYASYVFDNTGAYDILQEIVTSSCAWNIHKENFASHEWKEFSAKGGRAIADIYQRVSRVRKIEKPHG